MITLIKRMIRAIQLVIEPVYEVQWCGNIGTGTPVGKYTFVLLDDAHEAFDRLLEVMAGSKGDLALYLTKNGKILREQHRVVGKIQKSESRIVSYAETPTQFQYDGLGKVEE